MAATVSNRRRRRQSDNLVPWRLNVFSLRRNFSADISSANPADVCSEGSCGGYKHGSFSSGTPQRIPTCLTSTQLPEKVPDKILPDKILLPELSYCSSETRAPSLCYPDLDVTKSLQDAFVSVLSRADFTAKLHESLLVESKNDVKNEAARNDLKNDITKATDSLAAEACESLLDAATPAPPKHVNNSELSRLVQSTRFAEVVEFIVLDLCQVWLQLGHASVSPSVSLECPSSPSKLPEHSAVAANLSDLPKPTNRSNQISRPSSINRGSIPDSSPQTSPHLPLIPSQTIQSKNSSIFLGVDAPPSKLRNASKTSSISPPSISPNRSDHSPQTVAVDDPFFLPSLHDTPAGIGEVHQSETPHSQQSTSNKLTLSGFPLSDISLIDVSSIDAHSIPTQASTIANTSALSDSQQSSQESKPRIQTVSNISDNAQNGLVEKRDSVTCCSRRMTWDRECAVRKLGYPEKWNPLCDGGRWTLTLRLLRRLVALSCSDSTAVRDQIVSYCATVLVTSLHLFQQVLQSQNSPQQSQSSLDSVLAVVEVSSALITPCVSVAEFNSIKSVADSKPVQSIQCVQPIQSSSSFSSEVTDSQIVSPHVQETKKKLLSADISDVAVLLALDFAFHSASVLHSSPPSSDSDATQLATGVTPIGSQRNRPSANNLVDFCERKDSSFDPPRKESASKDAGSGVSQDVKLCNYQKLLRSAVDVVSGDKNLVVLISGASGCGKSTLSCLLANRLGLGTVLSTDTVRHILRSVHSKEEFPLLYASTYETGKFITEDSIERRIASEHFAAACRMKEGTKDATREAGRSGLKPAVHEIGGGVKGTNLAPEMSESVREAIARDTVGRDAIGKGGEKEGTAEGIEATRDRRLCLEGYLQQSEMLYDRLEFIIEQLLTNGESLVVEGVHLTGEFIRRIQKRFPAQCVPFIVYLANEDTHVDRFASRSRNFNTEPTKNKYVQHLENIRTIQRYLKQAAETTVVSPATLVDNSSISSAIRLMHATVVQHLKNL